MVRIPWIAAIVVGVMLSGGVRADDGWKDVFEEKFDTGWTERWKADNHLGATDQGVLLNDGKDMRAELKAQTFTAPAIRVEYDAAMRLKAWGTTSSDLSVFIGPVVFQFGGQENTSNAIVSQDPKYRVSSIMVDRGPLIQAANPKDPLVTHHVVAEINGRMCRLFVDKREAAVGVLDKPLEGPQAIAMYTWSGLAQFDNVKVQTKEKAEDVDPKLTAQIEAAAASEARERVRHAKPQMVVEPLRFAPTIHSVGFEWDIEGDNNHNATSTMRYRKKGDASWKDAYPLLRIDYRGWYSGKEVKAYKHFNMFAGSLMFLEPATTYEVELKVSDPDGGAEAKTLEIATNAVPSLGKPARTLHVVPDEANAQDGDGSAEKPFVGLAAAVEAAKPGDLFLLRAGKFKGAPIKTSGEENKYIAFKSAEPGKAVITSRILVSASHLWFQGLTFETDNAEEHGGIRGLEHGHHDIVAVRNTFNNCRYGLSNTDRVWNGDPAQLNRRWYIADNVCDGGPWTEYFTRLYMLADSDISYNRITTTDNHKEGDAISLRFSTNVDAHHNDMRDISDDFFEPDSSYANIRMWCNRGINAVHTAVSFQPQYCSPYYIVRNEFVLLHDRRSASALKTNVHDRNVIVNNTFVVRGRYAQGVADIIVRGMSRNNLWVHIYDNKDQKTNPAGAIWSAQGEKYIDGRYTIGGKSIPDWQTDVDYDGFAWDDVPDMKSHGAIWWGGRNFHSVADFGKAIGIETHGVQLARDEIFTISDLMAYAGEMWSSQRLALRPDSKAIDAGAVVPNLSDDFDGKAPDLGAHESGKPATHYGPRDNMPW